MLTGVTDDFQWRRTDGRDRGDGGGLRVKFCFCWKNSLAVSVSSFWGRNPVTDKTRKRSSVTTALGLAWQLSSLPGVFHSQLADGLQVHLVQVHLLDGSQQLLLVRRVRDADLADGMEQLNDLTCASGTVYSGKQCKNTIISSALTDIQDFLA